MRCLLIKGCALNRCINTNIDGVGAPLNGVTFEWDRGYKILLIKFPQKIKVLFTLFPDLINIELNKAFDDQETITTMKCSNNREHDLLDIFIVHKNYSDLVFKAGTYLWVDWSHFYRGIHICGETGHLSTGGYKPSSPQRTA